MTTSNFNLRGIPEEVVSLLKKKARDNKTSVNQLILIFVEQGLGIGLKKKKTPHNDLDHLMGTWSEKDYKQFMKNIEDFEKIDEEFWT